MLLNFGKIFDLFISPVNIVVRSYLSTVGVPETLHNIGTAVLVPYHQRALLPIFAYELTFSHFI